MQFTWISLESSGIILRFSDFFRCFNPTTKYLDFTAALQIKVSSQICDEDELLC